jgi:flavodoxin
MKTLIVYYSFTENNKKLADHVRKNLDCDMVGIETVRKRSGLSIMLDMMFGRKPAIKPVPYYLRDYDHIIFIAPVWGGKIAMPMKSYMIDEKHNIRRYSFMTLCGGVRGQKEKIHNELTTLVGKQPARVCELWINNLLTAEKKDTIKYTTGYRIEPNELKAFEKDIAEFLKAIQPIAAY